MLHGYREVAMESRGGGSFGMICISWLEVDVRWNELQMDAPLQCCLPLPAASALAMERPVGAAGRREHQKCKILCGRRLVSAQRVWWASTACPGKRQFGSGTLNIRTAYPYI